MLKKILWIRCSMNDLMIKIDNITKQYILGTIGGKTLNATLQSWWARKRGKEDPNTPIGLDSNLYNEKFLALNGVSFEVKKERESVLSAKTGQENQLYLKFYHVLPLRQQVRLVLMEEFHPCLKSGLASTEN